MSNSAHVLITVLTSGMLVCMALESLLSEQEKASRVNAYVWGQDLPSDDVKRLVFGDFARSFYDQVDATALTGIRFWHVVALGRLLDELSPDKQVELGVNPDHVRIMNNHLRQTGMWAIDGAQQTKPDLRLVS